MDANLARAIEVASELVETANTSIRAAMMALDPVERDEHQSVASMALFRLQFLAIQHPAIKVGNIKDFENDLRMISDATKARRMEIGRKLRESRRR